MTRIVDLAAANQLMGHVFRAQGRINGLQVQVSSGQVSQDYAGIARDSGRLVRLENTRDLHQRFVANNQTMDLKLKSTETTLASIRKTIQDFRFALLDYASGATDDRTKVAAIQDAAFKSLIGLQGLLNTEVDGSHLLAGSRVTTRPVDFGLTTLAAFQAQVDGEAVTVPTTREAHLAGLTLGHAATGNLTFDETASTISASTVNAFANVPVGATITVGGTGSNNGNFTVTENTGTMLTIRSVRLGLDQPTVTTAVLSAPGDITLDHADTGDLTFNAANGTVEAATPGSLAAIPVGSAFTVSGAAPANNGTYTVASNTGNVITIRQTILTDETPAPVAATIELAPWFRGDTVARGHRVDAEQSFALDLTAVDPAFEKAIRAMKLIAQGTFGSAGGLDQNPERIGQAIWLLNSAVDRSVDGTPPFGPERPGNLAAVEMQVGLNRVLIDEANERFRKFIGFLDARVAEIENIDPTEAITRLFDQAQALEASLTTMARIRQLSLVRFL
ncbi:MAG: hypothetical protein EA406_07050 [Rhodospirillales bacterium]|nr:MAG: hypothetical protein EA406_07050 [Rhodospirillales bacterium]